MPINLHLQRAIVSGPPSLAHHQQHHRRNNISDDNDSTHDDPYVESGSVGPSSTSAHRPLDVYTVGAFAAHHLGFDSGGMKPTDSYDLKTPTNNNNRDISQQVWSLT